MPRSANLTVVVPAYNEAEALAKLLPPLIDKCREHQWELIVVNDGSKDDTGKILRRFESDLKVITNESNLGYGAAIKRGVMAAKTEWVATFDGDGQHRIEDLEKIASQHEDYEAIIGRRSTGSHFALSRVPGKWILSKVANLLVGYKIPDINCGLRVMRHSAILPILNLSSDKFSLSASSLVAMIKMGYRIHYVPVHSDPRIGNSTVRQVRDGMHTVLLLMRLITLFDPMRIFLPLGLAIIGLGILYQIIGFLTTGLDINDFTILLIVSGLLIFVLALIADQISSLRRELVIFEHKFEKKPRAEDCEE